MTVTTHPVMDQPRKRVGVFATGIESGLERVLHALEAAFPVSFSAAGARDLGVLDGALALDPTPLPPLPAGVPRMVVPAGPQLQARGAAVALADDSRVQRALRGRAIREDAVALEPPLQGAQPQSVLACAGRAPVWFQRGGARDYLSMSAYPIAQMAPQEALRDHLRAGRFMGLLPLLHFLDRVIGAEGWEPAPLRASFVIDDPNLHWPSYGYLDYAEIAAQAERHGYHVGLAMVPLDGWLANPRAAALFKRNSSALSLVMHGNDHRSGELVRLGADGIAEAVIAQALRRTVGFERRTGVRVQRVMVPPHEVCSQPALRAMFRLGLDGACISRRYPWHGRPSCAQDALAEQALTADAWPLAKWHPTDMVAGGLPILPRCRIDAPWEDLAFRALLRQPLVLFGHSSDLARGLDLLAAAADYVNGLGAVEWGPLGWIAGHSFLTRRRGETLVVQMHSRCASLAIPPSVSTLVVRVPRLTREQHDLYLLCGGERVSMSEHPHAWSCDPLPVAGGTELQLTLQPERSLDPELVSARPFTPWPLVRRALVEGRDRIQPLSDRIQPLSRRIAAG
jgi:hypothetical protein